VSVGRVLLAALERLEARLAAVGAPVVEHLRPGLTDEEIDALTPGLPHRLPIELRTWYGWHDGARLDLPAWHWHLGNGLNLLSLQVAVERHDFLVRPQFRSGIPGIDFRDEWLPICWAGTCSIAVGTAGEATAPCPVHVFDTHGYSGGPGAGAPSVRAMVLLWIRALDEGYWVWDPEAGWGDHYNDLPADLRETDLIF